MSETFSCVSAPIQYAVLAGFENFGSIRNYVELCNNIHKEAGKFLHQRFIEIHLNCPEPQGAFYLFPDFENFKALITSRGIKSSEELSKRLLEDIGVALLPGSDFYMPDEFLGVRVTSVDYDGAKLMHDSSISGKEKPLMYTTLFPRLAEACERLEKWLR